MLETILMTLLVLVAAFLILLVLIQRGKGGGLAGAFGGMGGQSAFGTKAGDVFTRVTIGTAIVWILLCAVATKLRNTQTGPLDTRMGRGGSATEPQAPSGKVSPKGGENAGTAGETQPPGGGAPTSTSPQDKGLPAPGTSPSGGP